MDTLVDPPIVNPSSAITSTSETAMWLSSMYSPINIGDPRPGKAYKVSAGGIYTTNTSGTLTITPRIGLTTSGVTLGASGAQTVPVSVTGAPWYLEFTMVIRTIGIAASTATAIGNGFFVGQGTVATAGTALSLAFGGTSATFDATSAQGITIGWTLSVAGSCTPEWVVMQSLN
jgi:hypothetical protein